MSEYLLKIGYVSLWVTATLAWCSIPVLNEEYLKRNLKIVVLLSWSILTFSMMIVSCGVQ